MDFDFFSPTDDHILATALHLQAAFRSIYSIAGQTKNWQGDSMATPIGRYPEDRYNGYYVCPQGLSCPAGNPWFLATNAFAELYYDAARQWQSEGMISISAVRAALFSSIPSFSKVSYQIGETLYAGDARFQAVLQALREGGDDFLRRSWYHVANDGSMSEEFDRGSGFMVGADQLTWSHASLLTAIWQRAF